MTLGREIDLLRNYPKAKRNLAERAAEKTEEDRRVARKFDERFFDGERRTGYGGFNYNSRFWQPVVPTFVDHWGLKAGMKVLDVGCAKGFMMHDLYEGIPGIQVTGIDISKYAIENCIETMRDKVHIGNAKKLDFPDNSFDVTISINTIHNLDLHECIMAIKEIERVSKSGSFITVDAYRTDEEKERMFSWNLTAKTILSVDDWLSVFEEAGYSGDFYWFIP